MGRRLDQHLQDHEGLFVVLRPCLTPYTNKHVFYRNKLAYRAALQNITGKQIELLHSDKPRTPDNFGFVGES
jgi:hypothetical protein